MLTNNGRTNTVYLHIIYAAKCKISEDILSYTVFLSAIRFSKISPSPVVFVEKVDGFFQVSQKEISAFLLYRIVMAKTRPGAPKKGRSKKGHGGHPQPRSAAATSSSKAAAQPTKTVQTLMDATVAAMTQGEVDAALESARAAYAVIASAGSEEDDNSTNTTVDGIGKAAVCALLGEILLEAGDIEVARQVLTVAADLDADGTLSDALGGGPDKFLYLAQLSENGGRESVAWFERGAASLRSRLQQGGSGADADRKRGGEKTADDETRDKLAQVLCAVAEVWMTDLSFESDCEAQCEALVTEASLLAPTSPDVWQTLASVRVSQERLPDARAALQRSLDLWADLPPDHPAVPLFSVRVGLVRLLLTVDWAEKAAHIATTRLLREDDEAVEVWYLAGYAHYLQGQKLREGSADGESKKDGNKKKKYGNGEEDEDRMADQNGDSDNSWQDYWRDARRCLGRCLKEFKRQSYEDERLGQHAKELLDDVVAVMGPAPEGEDEEDEGEWVDDENEGEDGDVDDEDGDEDME